MSNQIIPNVDEWTPLPDQIIFTNSKNIISAPLSNFYHLDEQSNNINYFMINPKKSYNSDDLRNHLCLYMNYLEAFFDTEKEYFTVLAHIKFYIDCYPEYNAQLFLTDINRYILQQSIFMKTKAMVDYNYSLTLSYKSANKPQLQYTDEHAKALMQMSILMNMCIPLITHFAYIRRVSNIDEFLMDVYDYILYAPVFEGINIPSKLYETSISNVMRNEKNNAAIWAKQDIRGKDVVSHSQSAVRNIILNIIPKYTFNQNMVSLNYTSINKNNKFQVTDIAYEYSYVPLSSSKRDGEDNASEFDRFEANLIKTDESKYLQNEFNCQFTLNKIDEMFGNYYTEDELRFYRKALTNENGDVINEFQRQLVFNLFYKYFGDTTSVRAINSDDFVKLLVIAKKMLKANMMSNLPYIIGGKVEKIVARKTLNKKEFFAMQQDPLYPLVVDKYKNEKILNQIFGTIATIITSSFRIIDFEDPSINGLSIDVESNIIIHETLIYILLI
jgi:hypothetical protein